MAVVLPIIEGADDPLVRKMPGGTGSTSIGRSDGDEGQGDGGTAELAFSSSMPYGCAEP